MIFNEINYNKSTGIRYIYDAAGVKIAKEIYENGGTSRTNYFGNFVYEDTELKYILTDYGKIDVKTSVSYGGGEFPEIIVTRDYTRYYNITDHLGNVRVTFDETGEIMQEDSYYPFGMTMNGLNYTSGNKSYEKNKYLYNGKELQEDFGLDWYDYGARFYDAQLGRFTGVDALADTFVWVTPYNYAENSPIANIDLWGLQAVNYQAAMAMADPEGYSKMVDQRNEAAAEIDYVGVSISGNAFLGGGGGGDLNLAYVKGDGVFVNVDGKTGPGADISYGITFTIGHYSGEGEPTAKSTTKACIYENAGAFGVTAGASHDVATSPKTGKVIIGKNWNYISFGFSLGSKTVAGGSAGVSYYSNPLYLYKENEQQKTENKTTNQKNNNQSNNNNFLNYLDFLNPE